MLLIEAPKTFKDALVRINCMSKSVCLNQGHVPGASLILPGELVTLGEFYVEVGLGSPPQTLRVQVDTGSSTLAVFDRICQVCFCAARPRPLTIVSRPLTIVSRLSH